MSHLKKTLSILAVAIFLTSCSSKFIPLKSKYPTEPYIIETTRSKEDVWDAIIDLFAQKGIGIRIIDKQSGLIISDSKLELAVTTEDKSGKLIDPNAHVVAKSFYDPGPNKTVKPSFSIGEFNIRIKEAGGKTIININLLSIQTSYGDYIFPQKYRVDIRSGNANQKEGISLKNFEKEIAAYIK